VAPRQVLFLASNQLAEIARSAASGSADGKRSELVAILFAAAWFEGSINEAIHDLLTGHYHESDRIKAISIAAQAAGLDDRYARVERKLRVLCAAATGQTLDEKSEPWHTVLLLFQLRNWIVHLRPEIMEVREGREDEPSSLVSTQVHRFVQALRDVGAIKEIPTGRMVPIAMAVQMPGVGAWAYRVAREGLRTVDTWLPERHRKLASDMLAPPLPGA
jgi:hypothetical protein